MGWICLAKLPTKTSQNCTLCDLFEEASGYVKVLLNCQSGCPCEESPSPPPPMIDHTRLIKGQLEIRSDHNTQCAPARATQPDRTLFKKYVWLCCKREAILTLFLALRWLPGAGPWAAVASGRGPGCILCPGGCDTSDAPGLREQAVARGTSLAWGFKDLPFPPTPEAGVNS